MHPLPNLVKLIGAAKLAVILAGVNPANRGGPVLRLAHTLTQWPQSATALAWAWPPIWALSVMGAGLFWAFVLELFEDRSTLTLGQFAPALLLLLLGLVGALAPPSIARTFWLKRRERAYSPRPVRRLERMAGRSRRPTQTTTRANPGHIRSVCACRHRRANLGNLFRVRTLSSRL